MSEKQIISLRGEKTVYRDGDLAVKVFTSVRSKADVLQEALNQTRAEEAGILVPHVQKVCQIDGKWAILSDFAAGQTMHQYLHQHREEQQQILTHFVELQRQLHMRKSLLMVRQKPLLHHKICEAELDATQRYELHLKLDSMPEHDKLCHGDFHPANVIMGADGKDCITDWPRAAQGNASADAAQSWIMLSLSDGQELADAYLDIYCAASETDPQYVRSWIPIMAGALLSAAMEEEKAFLYACAAGENRA